MKDKESKAALRGNIIMLDKINLIAMLKIAQFLQCTFIILTRKTQENLKYKGDIPLVAYIDSETTAPTGQQWIEPENRKMFAVSYVIIFAFEPELHINRIIIECSFGHSLKMLADLSYLTREQVKFKDEKTLLQLKDCQLFMLEIVRLKFLKC